MQKLPLYKRLVNNKEVVQKNLLALTGIGMLISSSDENGSSLDQDMYNLLKQDSTQQQFVLYNFLIGIRGD